MEFFSHPDFWKFVSIPFVAALVGWSTNWVAIKMLFYPVDPIGWPPWLGWWGIIPSKAAKMGAITTDTTLSKLGTLREVFDAMEPDRIAQYLIRALVPRVDEYMENIMLQENPEVWELLPTATKDMMVSTARRKLPETVYELVDKIREEIDVLVDIKDVVVRQLLADRTIVNRIFEECGEKEFAFIIRSGLYFGFAFGLIQMTVWILYPAWWILPLFGVLVGYLTNWIALRIVFQPLNPKKIGPFTIQGLFLKRQKEVAEIWTSIITRDVLTVQNIIGGVLHGPHAERAQRLVRQHIRRVVDEAVGISKPVVQLTVGVKQFLHLKEEVSERALDLTEEVISDPRFNQERAHVVKRLMQERMEQLSSQDFQYLLRPAFQEEEIKLILLGAALGFGAGIAQLYFVFGGI